MTLTSSWCRPGPVNSFGVQVFAEPRRGPTATRPQHKLRQDCLTCLNGGTEKSKVWDSLIITLQRASPPHRRHHPTLLWCWSPSDSKTGSESTIGLYPSFSCPYSISNPDKLQVGRNKSQRGRRWVQKQGLHPTLPWCWSLSDSKTGSESTIGLYPSFSCAYSISNPRKLQVGRNKSHRGHRWVQK